MIKKIGVITLFHNNYNSGAILQAMALEKAVETLGYDCEIIDYYSNHVNLASTQHSLFQKLRKKILHVESKGDLINIISFPIQKKWRNKYNREFKRRKDNYVQFINENLRVSKTYDGMSITLANNEFDAFITGSDQVWRPSSFDPNYYLAFADKNKTVLSYAASFGVEELSDKERENILPLINQLDAVSLREESALQLLSKLANNKVERVLDPTLLFKRDFWEKYVKKSELLINKKYVFSYQIGDNNFNRDIATRIGKILGIEVVTMPGISRILPYDFMYGDKKVVDGAPNDFISLIANAEMIVTDSFHASIFSIIFEKKFYVLERFARNDRMSMNSRIYDLLKLFSLDNRLIKQSDSLSGLNLNEEIKSRKDKWEYLRKNSWNYLEKALNIEKRE